LSYERLLLGCIPANNPSDTLVINTTTKHFANIGGIVGSDEVWFNKGDRRYYGLQPAARRGPVLGVIGRGDDQHSNNCDDIVKESSRLFINAPNKAGAFELVDKARAHDCFRPYRG
jgi:hypothetical protein